MQLNFKPFPNLLTERLLLRQLILQDAAEIFLLRSDAAVNEFIHRPIATSIDDAKDFINKIKNIVENNEGVYWGITLKNESKIIGAITFWNIEKENCCAEIGYELLTQYQGKGIMQEAITKVIEFGFATLKLSTIKAFTHHENYRSYKILEKHGFKRDLIPADKNEEKLNGIMYSLNNPTVIL